MSEIETYGTITPVDAAHATIRFERRLPAPIERVWAAITDPGQLATWLAASSVDLRAGGTVEHVFDPADPGGQVTGIILRIEPMTILEYEWRFLGEPDSILRYDLVADGDTTVVTLTHRLLGIDQVSGYGAGWHAYLDTLAAVLTRTDAPDWDTRFAEVKAAYASARWKTPVAR
jgi:uncharacterized protein YndB with AHSA1/START domain